MAARRPGQPADQTMAHDPVGQGPIPPDQGGMPVDERPTNVVSINSWPQTNLNMALATKEVPVCIRLCNELELESQYTASIRVFDTDFLSITVAGRTIVRNAAAIP